MRDFNIVCEQSIILMLFQCSEIYKLLNFQFHNADLVVLRLFKVLRKNNIVIIFS
jgi:hypothetical protein